MLADDEIERRIDEDDTPVTARRKTIARKVSAFGAEIAVVSEQLHDLIAQVRQEIGDNQDIITVEKLAIYTDIPKVDLKQWLVGYKPSGNKRKRQPISDTNNVRNSSRTVAPQLLSSDEQNHETTHLVEMNGNAVETTKRGEPTAVR